MVSPSRAFELRLAARAENWGHNQQNTGSHAAPSRGRRVLNIADNPEAVSTHTGFIVSNY